MYGAAEQTEVIQPVTRYREDHEAGKAEDNIPRRIIWWKRSMLRLGWQDVGLGSAVTLLGVWNYTEDGWPVNEGGASYGVTPHHVSL